METSYKTKQRVDYKEIYISDIPQLKKIFLDLFDVKRVNEDFGLPFLLMKKENKIVAFSSLINNNEIIDFKIFETEYLSDSERESFVNASKEHIHNSNSANFKNVKQLKSSIQNIIDWLNL